MIRPPLRTALLLTLLLLATACGRDEAPKEETPPPMTPEAQAARISTVMLSRNMQKLREEAFFVRYREEGRLLLEEFFGEEE